MGIISIDRIFIYGGDNNISEHTIEKERSNCFSGRTNSFAVAGKL
jgi:hypothetical protein